MKNPSLHLLYRFSTTAIPGREQGIQFPRNLPGIVAWNSIREGAFDDNEVQKFVAALKRIVASASCPKDRVLPASLLDIPDVLRTAARNQATHPALLSILNSNPGRIQDFAARLAP